MPIPRPAQPIGKRVPGNRPGPISRAFCLVSSLALLVGPATAFGAEPVNSGNAPASEAPEYLRDIRPILASHCLKCHGPDDKTRKGGLRLDVRTAALAPAKSEARAIVPGRPEASELVKRMTTDDPDEVMPPPSTKNPLTEREKDLLRRWIAAGAEYQPHWAFVPPRRPPVPVVPGLEPGRASPIDHFIRARLAREGLDPSPEADRLTLVRRAYLDLIGLPPTPEEADAFVRDSSPDAWEKLVDRLLASEHYGERWARRWMDLARYSDTNGYEKDRPRSIWPWRDWVIRAYNRDLPFDRFTIEQIAGDLLPGATLDQRVATGFHRNTMLNEEGGIDPLEYRFHALVDRVHTTATAWLGLTLACAQCHTHKYDPIPQREYYGFMGFLDNSDEPEIDVPSADLTARRNDIEARAVALDAGLVDRFPPEENLTLVTPTADQVAGESPAERLPDGSYRFGGPVPDKTTAVFTFTTSLTNVVLLNLDALADDALPNKGPGRVGHGNFVLSEVRVSAGPASAPWGSLPPVRIAGATADFEQSGFPVANAFDGKENTGWAIAGEGHWNVNRRATFRFAQPVTAQEGLRFEVRLVQHHGDHHVLGRVRLAFGTERPDPRPLEERRREHRDRQFAAWQRRETERARRWTPLRPVSATSKVPVLTVEDDDSVFVSSDQTKSDTYELRFRNDRPRITAIRLEVLPDDRLPRRGPGRVAYEGPIGDFFLSTFALGAGGQPVKLVRPSQSFADGGNTAAKALDEDQQSGWAVNGGQGRRHVAVFNLEKPLEGAPELGLSLLFEKYYAAGLGRFRISVTTDPRGAEAVEMPDDLQDLLLAGPALERSAGQTDRLLRYFLSVAPELAGEREAIARLRREKPAYPTTLVMQERPPENPRITFVRNRGEFLQPTEPVKAGLPAVFAELASEPPRDRLEFARWLVSRENPLTARVTVNRQWQAFFGAGLVRTMEDFGFQGELPTHPELLDWLAVEFMDRGWSMKRLHKLIVLSGTYRQASHVTPHQREIDPQNRWLGRGPRFRIEGELVRDLALRSSGLLSPKLGGPSVFPPQLPSITREGTYGPLDWNVSTGPDRYRRGLYTFAKRTAPYATFQTFDAPSGEACVARREASNTPLQSLTLLNDDVFVEAAQALGREAAALAGDPRTRAAFLFRRTLTRPPADAELAAILAFYEAQQRRLATGALSAADLAGPLPAGTPDPDPVARAAWTAVARALLNLDETVTRG
jgi:mono/diheme cytochrome c family protein